MSASSTELTGLDGRNPLAFMAAVGTLRLAASRYGDAAKLRWVDGIRIRPQLELPEGAARVVDIVSDDLGSWSDASPELCLKDSAGVFDLKPEPDLFHAYCAAARDAALAPGGTRRFADFAAAFAAETGRDNNGYTKPTALDFTAGQQKFLVQVRKLRAGLEAHDIEEALFGPWTYERELPNLRWDAAGERLYALRATNPGKDKAGGVPGADWLAFQALPLFPVMPLEQGIQTTGVPGRGKVFRFAWPIWNAPLTIDVVRGVLASDWTKVGPSSRAAHGVSAVLVSEVRRNDKGYGNFSPSKTAAGPGSVP